MSADVSAPKLTAVLLRSNAEGRLDHGKHTTIGTSSVGIKADSADIRYKLPLSPVAVPPVAKVAPVAQTKGAERRVVATVVEPVMVMGFQRLGFRVVMELQ